MGDQGEDRAERGELRATVARWLERALEDGYHLALEPEAIEAERLLARTLPDGAGLRAEEGADDLDARLLLGRLRLCQAMALPETEAVPQLNRAVEDLIPCFVADVGMDELPEPVVGLIAEKTAEVADRYRTAPRVDHAEDNEAWRELWRRIVDAVHRDRPMRLLHLGYLCDTLWKTHHMRGRTADLEESLATARRMLWETDEEHPMLPWAKVQLSKVLCTHYEVTGDRTSVDVAVTLARDSLRPEPETPAALSKHSLALSRALLYLYARTGAERHLREARRVSEKARDATPDDTDGRAAHERLLEWAARAETCRSHLRAPEWLIGLRDLRKSQREYAVYEQAGRHARWYKDRSLALARAAETADLATLSDAVAEGRLALALVSDRCAGRVGCLQELGRALRMRFRLTGVRDDLDAAIEAGRASVHAVARYVKVPRFYALAAPYALSVLGRTLLVAFSVTGRQEQLEEAIDLARQAVRIADADHAARPEFLEMLAEALDSRYELTGSDSDRAAATAATREALRAREAAVSHRRPDALDMLAEHGLAVEAREARRAFDEKNRPVRESDMLARKAETLMRRPWDVAREGLDSAVKAASDAVELLAYEDPERADRLGLLSTTYVARFRRTGTVDDLDRAVDAARRAVAAPHAPQRRGAHLSALGMALDGRARATGSSEDMNEAVEVFRLAQDAFVDLDSRRRLAGRRLRNALVSLYDMTDEHMVESLDEAEDLVREALRELTSEHPDRGDLLNELGLVMSRRHERRPDPEVLDTLIDTAREAAALPADPLDRGIRLGNLCKSLMTRWRAQGDPADLDHALRYAETATSMFPRDHPDWAVHAMLWAEALLYRAGETGKLTDLRAGWEKLTLAARNDAARPSVRIRAARSAGNTAVRDPSRTTYAESVGLLEEAVRLMPRTAPRGLSRDDRQQALKDFGATAALGASLALALRDNLTDAGPAHEQRARGPVGSRARGFLGLRFPRRRSRRTTSPLAPGPAPSPGGSQDQELLRGALRMLEQGRTVMLGELLRTRGDLTHLRARHPELARRFVELRNRLDSTQAATTARDGARPDDIPFADSVDAVSTDARAEKDATGPSAGEAAARAAVDERRSIAAAFDQVITEIRAHDGFDSFLQPPHVEELIDAAQDGPVVVLSVGPQRSDALLLTPDGTLGSVPLPDLDATTLEARTVAFAEALQATESRSSAERMAAQRTQCEVLEWLWDTAAEPVLQALDLHGPPPAGAPWPRLWWVPSGLLGRLPLHAAGYHRAETGTRTVMDRVVSSYTPSITALRHARRPVPAAPTPEQQALIVSLPETPGQRPLRWVRDEVDRVSALLPQGTVLEQEAATRNAVLTRLDACTFAHFACHGTSDRRDPSHSALLLYDHGRSRDLDGDSGPLTVASLAPVRLDNAQLAYLSACHTAVTEAESLVDEAIHLTSAFQLAGFRHVVGTLWAVADTAAPSIAEGFYRELREASGDLDASRSAFALHQITRETRDLLPATPSLWAAYVHAGA
ncbi:CHAT domain-containing protein [Streptomyces sp. NEAU-PBA10]|uniref:CHAT domain-containing tetratricopeptide repeat protein n=2 Tax=Streptomyces TaxID=1883 RepID=UPI0005636ED2|nr:MULTISPECIES: CHAT domain-containing protein [Streptomyces]MBL0777412.1 CHAT domain-containing protein [Streptomyces albidoflavus]MBV1957679.1 CHAT domain-containing protein [Streptomyces sp. BV333]UDF11198.1 CHAT domain-containing protein [Streptomyces sp. WA1-19]